MHKSSVASVEALVVFAVVTSLFYQMTGPQILEANKVTPVMVAISVTVLFVGCLRSFWNARVLVAMVVLLSGFWLGVYIVLLGFAFGVVVISSCAFVTILVAGTNATKDDLGDKNNFWAVFVALIPIVGAAFNGVALLHQRMRDHHTSTA